MKSLFPQQPIIIHLPDLEIIYYPNFFKIEEADKIYAILKKDIIWQQDDIKVFGKIYAQPRLTALYGNEGKLYTYSNITMQPHPWNGFLQKIRTQVENISDSKFTTVLLNYYRDGKDSIGWHADNEKELGVNPIIASVSFGADRMFQLKHNTIKKQKTNMVLEHGSLLLMKGSTQHFWKHQIPKTTKLIVSRINLTFRLIK